MKKNISRAVFSLICLAAMLAGFVVTVPAQKSDGKKKVLVGKEAYGDFTTDAPGVRRKIVSADMPKPYDTKSAVNGARIVPRPVGAMPQVPEGFTVSEFQTGLTNPRLLKVAPNGDVFVAESRANRVRVMRPSKDGSKAESSEIFVEDLKRPFGIAFYPSGANPQYIYIANTDSIIRIPYKNGDLKASAKPEVVVPDIPGWGELRGGGHWTRDIVFSKDGKKMFVSVGSLTNVWEKPTDNETNRATILEYNPDGTGFKVLVTGIRNAVGIAVHPQTGDLWASVNERDGLGDDLVPDYITRVRAGDFFGWPWFYIGPNYDPRHEGKFPEMRSKVKVPDVLVQPHSASLQMMFYDGKSFPKEYRNEGFAAFHGSWNREKKTGYKVVRVPLKNGVPNGEYEDFLTGFVTPDGGVWGRPVGVAVAKDGSMLVSDDGGNLIWRVSAGK